MEQKIDIILQKIVNYEKEIDQIKNICQQILYENKELTEKVKKQEKTINYLQTLVNSRNLVVHGIQEDEKDEYELQNNIINIINEKLEIKCEEKDIDMAFRIGKKSTRARPIKIVLFSNRKKEEIYNGRKKLKGTSIYVNRDLPIEIRKELKEKRLSYKKEMEKTSAKRVMTQSSEENEEPPREKIEQENKKLKESKASAKNFHLKTINSASQI